VTEAADVVVIGGVQAGLATQLSLERHKLGFVILGRSRRFRHRHLVTPIHFHRIGSEHVPRPSCTPSTTGDQPTSSV